MLVVPDHLNRNAPNVTKAGDPADTGADLIRYMCRRIGVQSLAGKDVLDIGCGVRFSQAIFNRNLPIGSYTGVDVSKPVIDFLISNVEDARMRYFQTNASNTLYNPKGEAHHRGHLPGLGDAKFDIACMFSVITHQNIDEAEDTFSLIRSHILDDGFMFFSFFLHEESSTNYKELIPEKPGLRSSYSESLMTEMLERTGWEVLSLAPAGDEGVWIQSSLLCRPKGEG